MTLSQILRYICLCWAHLICNEEFGGNLFLKRIYWSLTIIHCQSRLQMNGIRWLAFGWTGSSGICPVFVLPGGSVAYADTGLFRWGICLCMLSLEYSCQEHFSTGLTFPSEMKAEKCSIVSDCISPPYRSASSGRIFREEHTCTGQW